MQANRREFFKQLALMSSIPFLKPQLLFADQANLQSSSTSPIIVFIFLRGAQDGLSVLSPYTDENYLKLRPNIALKEKNKDDLIIDNRFKVNPALNPLFKFWNNKNLAFITEFGNPLASRSHFDAQDFFESGSPGTKNIEDGIFNRSLNSLKNKSIMSAIAVQSAMPRSLKGSNQTISMSSLKDFRPPKAETNSNASKGFEDMYQQATDKVFRGIGEETFESLNKIKSHNKTKSKVDYPKNKLADNLKDIASLINSNLGLSIAVTEMGGWDTHVNQGNENGQFSKRLEELSTSLEAFTTDLGPQFQNTIIITCTEFGRTAKENGNKGTDHGHGSVSMLLGGKVNGGKIYGNWSGLSIEKLYEERDIPISTDYRDLLGKILGEHLKISNLNEVFPGHTFDFNNVKNIIS